MNMQVFPSCVIGVAMAAMPLAPAALASSSAVSSARLTAVSIPATESRDAVPVRFAPAGQDLRATISEDLTRLLATTAPTESVPVLLFLRERVDLTAYSGRRDESTKLIRELQAIAASTQPPILARLRAIGVKGDLRSFWITNAISFEATSVVIREISQWPDVVDLDFDAPGAAPDVDVAGEGDPLLVAPTWSIEKIRADEVWSTFGLTGAGIVLGSMDTGFAPSHPALAGKWRGGSNSWRDLVNGLPDPYDDHGHGTHTIGTLVGGDGDGPLTFDIGVAFGARFIAVKVLDENNAFSSSSIVIAGAQWILDPDGDPETADFPHVVNNSWYFFSPTFTGYYNTVAAWRAAGIVPVFCIGNEGPGAQTTRAPAHYNNCIGVGGTDASDSNYDFTSWGPSPSGTSYPADRRKPELSAPGELVLSSVPSGGYQSWSGTSMAAPHVAGTIALMLEANPILAYGGLLALLEETAVDLGDPDYDYIFGYGRIDAYEAVVRTVASAPSTASLPAAPRLEAWPNPFSSGVSLRLPGLEGIHSVLEVLDPAGRRLRTVSSPTDGLWFWDGLDQAGRRVTPGVYFVRVSPGTASATVRQHGIDATRVVRVRE